MKYHQNSTVHGFHVLRADHCHEVEGDIYELEHEGTGAKVFWLDNNVENMVFSITFRTLPQDSTGVFHILEHSVLCGSRKYPVKEPFVELLKSSMNTFLNAMTFPDMTMYPVSSRNPRDLMNLAEVYLDAVFSPLAVTDPKRFYQEGWHVDRNEEGNPEFKGVVYNEMKGSLSETEALIDQELASMLFPDTSYGYNSGGDPEEITDLTWERFRDQYKKHYHPSNALVYLDGALPIDEILDLLDQYFSAYEKITDIPEFSYQIPRGNERTIRYELGKGESPEDKGYFTIARITGTWEDRCDNLARAILCDVLTGNNESPLKHAVLENKIAKDFSISVDDTGIQSWIALHAEHITDGKEQDLLDLIDEMGKKILRDGLDHSAVEASMNRAIFNLREEEEPQGIGRCIRCLGTWLYGGNPEDALKTESLIQKLREYLKNGIFEKLAADMLLNRENSVILHTIPSTTEGEEKRHREAEKVKRMLSDMTENEKKKEKENLKAVRKWQEGPDRPEDLEKLPLLRLEDADVAPEWVETEISQINGIKILRHCIPCNGVVHLRAYFSLTDLSLDELTIASLFAGMLGKLPTEKHDALQLQQEIKCWTGSFGFAVITRTRSKNWKECTPMLVAYASALDENVEKAQELMAEVLLSTRLTGQKERVLEIMRQNEIGARQRIVSAGHLIAVKRCLSCFSAEGAVKNALDGDRAVRYIHEFSINPEESYDAFAAVAERILSVNVCASRMILSVTCGNDRMPDLLAGSFPAGTPAPEAATFDPEERDYTGYRIPAQVGFAARGYHLNQCGKEFTGSMWLAASILSLDYLWNKVRVQGGAYGAGFQIDRSGNLFSYSFRDPSPEKTIQADLGASAFLKKFAREERHLEKYIISALNELNPLLSPRDKGALADIRILTGYSRAESERIRKEVLLTTPQQLVDCGEWLDRFATEGNVCIVANDSVLKKCKGLRISDL